MVIECVTNSEMEARMILKNKFSRYYRLTAVALLFCVSNLAYAGKLNADEVRQLVSGNTLEFKHVDDARLKTRFYASNGTFRQLNKKGKKQKGKWSVTNDGQLCNKRKGEGVCHRIYKQGDVWNTYIGRTNPTGGDKHINTIQKVLNGNPYGL
jgi:hypothetical protein